MPVRDASLRPKTSSDSVKRSQDRTSSEPFDSGPRAQGVRLDHRSDGAVARQPNDRIPPPSVRQPLVASLKRPRAEASQSDTVWTEVPLREGYGNRLLRLYGGSGDQPLEGRLVLHNGEEDYEAVSYSIEEKDGLEFITIISGSSRKSLRIKSNLAGALRQLRLRESPRLLWINSICIDQYVVAERNHHIERVGKIFNMASHVCLWLGAATPGSTLAFGYLKRVAGDSIFQVGEEDSDYREALPEVYALLKQRWFTRCWALLESALAKTALLCCGRDEISWTDFVVAVALLGTSHSTVLSRNVSNVGNGASTDGDAIASTAGYRFIDISSNIFRKSDDGTILGSLMSLESLVCTGSLFEATTIHDNIYTFLSFAEDTGIRYVIWPGAADSFEEDDRDSSVKVLKLEEDERMPCIEKPLRHSRVSNDYLVDYSKKPVEVCRDFIQFTVPKAKSLDILVRPWAPAHYRPALPSWIPTLVGRTFDDGVHHRKQADTLVGRAGLDRKVYAATRRHSGSVKFGRGEAANSLFVDGCVLDFVNKLGSAAYNGAIPLDWIPLGGWTMDTEGSPPQRFWRTLIANRTADGQNPPPYLEKVCQYVFDHRDKTRDSVTTETDDYPEQVTQFLARVRSIIWARRMISTEQGALLGLAPEETQKGDLICILFGCSVPVVLRKEIADKRTGDYHYKIVGECYIHGMMDGEALDIREARKIPITQFEIS